MLDWSTDEKAIMAGADELLRIALEFNAHADLEGTACCAVFHALRETVSLIYSDAAEFVEECLKSGINCSENASLRYDELCRSLEEGDLF